MPLDNLSVSVTADTSELRASLALAQADLRAFGAETRKLATDIRSGGDATGVLRSQFEQVASQLAAAKSNVTDLTGALREHKTGIDSVNDALKGSVAPLTAAIGGFKEMAEFLGVAFAVERIGEFAKSMAELGEKTLNSAAAVGLSVEDFSRLNVAMTTAGGDADAAQRTIERLGHNMQSALAQPTGQAAKAFRDLGISEAEIRKGMQDTDGMLTLLAQKWASYGDSLEKTSAYYDILGRGFDKLIPYFRQGAAGIEEFKKQADDTGAVLKGSTAEAMAETGEKLRTLSESLKGLGVEAFMAYKKSIDTTTDALTRFVQNTRTAITELRSLIDEQVKAQQKIESGQGSWTGTDFRTLWRRTFGGEASADLPPPLAGTGVGFGDRAAREGIDRPVFHRSDDTSGGGRGRAAKDDSDADERELQRELDEEQRMREEALTSDQKIQDLKFTRYRDEINNELALGKISATQALRQEEELRTEQWTYDQAYFQKKIDAAQGDAKQTQKLLEEQAAAYEKYVTDIQNLDAKIELANQKAAQKSAEAFTQLFDQIGSTFESTIAGMIEGTTTWQQGLQKIFNQILQSFIKMIGDMLSQWAASGLQSLGIGTGASAGSGLSGVLSSALGGLFGGGAGGAGASFLIPGTDTALAGAETIGLGSIGGGGAAASLLDLLPLLAFSKGGIVPSAQGGWAVPSMGPGGVLAQLHSNEMVLPANISGGLQNMIAGGGGASISPIFNINAMDWQSFARFAKSNAATFVAAINLAMRNGAMVRSS